MCSKFILRTLKRATAYQEEKREGEGGKEEEGRGGRGKEGGEEQRKGGKGKKRGREGEGGEIREGGGGGGGGGEKVR